MRCVVRKLLLTATAALSALAVTVPAAAAAPARVPVAAQTQPLPQVILKYAERGTRLALSTTGAPRSKVTVAPLSASPREGWEADHVPGGRFSLYWAPGHQTEEYLVATHAGATVQPEGPGTTGPGATLFDPAPGEYAPLSVSGTSPRQDLTYLGHGKVALRPEGCHGPTGRQLWKVTG